MPHVPSARAPLRPDAEATAADSTADPSPIQAYLEGLHARFASLAGGALANYIPELAKANPNAFSICLTTTEGRVYEVGDSRVPFTIQSISKPLTYGMALDDRGLDAVLRKIGVEPTGDAFNSISLEPGTGRPLNPMINAGAIAAASMVRGHSQEDKVARLLAVYSLYAGRPLALDAAVYESERDTGHRNRAIGHMLRNFDILEDPDSALDLYFRQCSVAVDCRDLSAIAATLANGGVNPSTNERAVAAVHVDRILSVMTTCGLYDAAGEWVFQVGMPAKSGVGGGILVVLPGQLGIGVFSPLLDSHGNSVRGLAICRELSRDLELHFLRTARSSRSVFRAQYSVAQVRSKRLRPEPEREVLRRTGQAARVFELQGDLMFASIEAVIGAVMAEGATLDMAVLDFKRVTGVGGPTGRLLFDLLVSMARRGQQLLLASCAQHDRLVRFIEEQQLTAKPPARIVCLPGLDGAIEWCENRLLAAHGPALPAPPAGLADNDLCRHLDAAQLALLEPLLGHRRFASGQPIVHRGEPANDIFLIVSGQATVALPSVIGAPKRLSTLCAGMSFGDLAVIDRRTRSADVTSSGEVTCRVLTAETFDRLGRQHPEIKIVLLQNMLRSAYQIVSRLSDEVAALGS